MKKLLLAVIPVLILTLASCNSNSPKHTAETFLKGLYHMDYKEAKTVATEDTKKMLDMMEQFSSMMPDSSKESAKKIQVTVKEVKEDGDKATAIYTTSESTAEQKLDMVKQNGKWMVQWSKQDAAGGDMGGDQMEEPMTDSTATMETAPVDTATTPVN